MAIAAAVVLGCSAPASAATSLIGNQAVEVNADSDSAGNAEAFQSTATASGAATDVFVYLDATAPTKLTVGLYADAAGHPGTLLAQGSLVAPKGGAWNDVPLAGSASLASGTKYWIAVLSPSGSGTIKFRDRKASGASETSSSTTLSSLPATWTTGVRYSDAFPSAYAIAGVADTSPPTQPQSFAVTTKTATSIATSWSASTDNVGVAGYNVYLDGVKVGSTQSLGYTFNVSCATSHTLGVEAYDAAGNVSARSTISGSSGSCPDTTPPSTPTGFMVTSSTSTSISTLWSASSDNVGVTGYDLYVGAQKVGTTSGTSYTFTGFVCGQVVTLGVVATDAAGNRSPQATLTASTTACPDTTPPSQPQSFAQTAATTSSVSTSWVASTDNVGVTGYRLYLDGTQVGTTTVTTFTFSGLACGTSHPAGVEAFDAAGNVSGRSSISVQTTACPDTTAPTAPSSFVITASSARTISTVWSASTDNVAVTGYAVYVGQQQVGTTTATSYDFSGFACGQVVTLGVEAYDAAGNHSIRTTISGSTAPCGDTTPPTQPSGLAVTGTTATTISVGWTASTDDTGVAGYSLYVGSQKIGSTQATAYTFTVSCGTAYTLGVEAFDAAGNTSTRATVSASSASCPDTTPPTQPTNFAMTGSTQTSVATSWTAATDNVGVAGYTLYLNGLQAGTSTTTTYTFWSLTCGTTYTAALEAVDGAGNTSTRATLNVTTAACPDTTPPSQPTGFLVTSSAPTSISTMWSPSSDNVGVAGYKLYLDGAVVTTVTGTSYTFGGVQCGTPHTLGVAAYDAAGNASLATSLSASTAACPDTTPPTVSITAPAAGASLSGSVALSANASDNVGVASVQFTVDGTPVGPTITAAPYAWTWDSRTVAGGTHQIGAVATDAAHNSANAVTVSVSVSNSFDTSNALKAVIVGPGFTDASTREVVRTTGDRVYMFVADDTAQRRGTGPGVIHAYKADQSGIPTSFSEVDASRRPSATGSSHVLGAPDVRLDRNGLVHLVYINNTNNNVIYQTFSTLSDTWGPTEVIGTNGAPITSYILREGNAALVLDGNDIPRVVYSTGSSLVYRSRAAGSWSAPATVVSAGMPIHPQLACDGAGTLYLAWLQDGTNPSIHYSSRPNGSSWSPDEIVAGTDVLWNSNSDQGPSIVVTSSGVPYVLYVSAKKTWTNGADYGAVRVRYRTGTGWSLDAIPTDMLTHTPQIYTQNNDIYAFLGHDTNIHYGYAWQAAGGAWSPYTMMYGGATVDGSANIRWDPQRETNPNVIDTGFYDEDIYNDKTYLPQAYYMAVLPRGAQPSGTSPPDTTPPTVSLTAPASGSTVSGNVTVAASASDNVGVAGVQFTLDGSPLSTEVIASPYSAAWNTTSAAAGTHVLAAVARDAAGNRTTSSSVTVTVNNAAPPDTTPPTVSLTAPAAGTTVSNSVNVTATAADNVGVAGVRFTLDGVTLGTEVTTGPYSVSWNTTLASNGSHVLGAVARDAAGNTASATTVTVTVSNTPPPDTTPPTVSLTAPTTGSTVSGTITVSANASDNVGVAGVQFMLDGATLGIEDTSAPYSVVWNTTASSAGSHVLGATARDAAGNRTSAPTVTVTVNNAQPSVLIGDTTTESSADSDGAGQAEAFSFVATASGSLSTLRVYVDSGSAATKIFLGLYAASGAHPGALLTQGSISTPLSAAWNAASVPAVTITAGATYWIALLSPAGSGTLRFRDRSSGGASETSSQTTLGALPSTWVVGTAYHNAPVAAYGS